MNKNRIAASVCTAFCIIARDPGGDAYRGRWSQLGFLLRPNEGYEDGATRSHTGKPMKCSALARSVASIWQLVAARSTGLG